MQEVTHQDYLAFIQQKESVIIEDTEIPLKSKKSPSSWGPPDTYSLERGTVWSFPDRGNWATHSGNYRGNWSPYIPRNLILKYSQEGDWILDQMMGAGTTLVEAKLLGRNAIGVDINPEAVMLARARLDFSIPPTLFSNPPKVTIKTFVGDARNLDKIEDNKIDLIATHPPYANIISYTKKRKITNDLSQLSFPEYIKAMAAVAKEAFRVLKPGKICALLIGDTRKNKHYVPIAANVMEVFLDAGFILKEDIIKLQWNMKGTRERWRARTYDFYLIMHEHIFVFRKPASPTEYKKFKFSTNKWRGKE